MQNNGMIVYKESFISKIKNFFRKIFIKENKQNNYIKEKTTDMSNSQVQDNFMSDLKVDAKSVMIAVERENFLRELDGNEKALNMLSMDRLIELEKYYNTVIEQNAQKIRELKTTA